MVAAGMMDEAEWATRFVMDVLWRDYMSRRMTS